MNSNFNKSMLGLVMLSAISQTYPMVNFGSKVVQHVGPDLVKRAGTLMAGVTSAGAAGYGLNKLAANQAPVVEAVSDASNQEFTNELVEVLTPNEAKGIAAKAAAKLAKGKTAVVEGYTSCKDFVVEKATDREFLAQGFCGMVTVGSVSYLLHKSGALVLMKKHWKFSVPAVVATATTLGTLAYMYPETALNVVKSVANPYVALGAGAAVAAYNVGSRFSNKIAAGCSAAGVAVTGLAVGAANYFGYADTPKMVSNIAGKSKDFVVGTAKLANKYVVAPVVAKALEYPKTAIGLGVVAAAPVVGYGAFKAYKAWKKPVVAPKAKKVKAPVNNHQAPQQPNGVPAGQNNNMNHQQRPQAGAGYVAAPIVLDRQVNQGIVNRVVNVVHANPKAEIVTLLIQIASTYDQAALDKANTLAGNDQELKALITNFVNGQLVKLIRAQKRGVPCAQCVLNKVYAQEKALMDKIAAKCGVGSFGLANL